MSGSHTRDSITDGLTLEDFEYELPPELIAQQPAACREESRLMVVDRTAGSIAHHVFRDLPSILKAGDLLILNDTRVVPARIVARRATGGLVEILLLRPEPARPGIWEAMATPLKKLKAGEKLHVDGRHDLTVEGFIESVDGQRRVTLDLGSGDRVYELLSSAGLAPLPPYIQRDRSDGSADVRASDLERYQTVFARAPGAVAAPTAGLHFTESLLARLDEVGVQSACVTLHVGPGTFKPISTSLEAHTIESEEFVIPAATAQAVNRARNDGRRVIAVGTTSTRALETAGASGRLEAVSGGASDLYIKQGYEFRIIDGLLTNFHLSRSSLLVLVSAFAGHELIMKAYRVAVEERYRFFSYGDAMLIL